jgi:alpha-beta hydrolase superfamily lysophospholipase
MQQQNLGTANQETVEGVSGLKILFRSWRPDEKPNATVVIIPGFNAHSGYYEWVAEQLVAGGGGVALVEDEVDDFED